jgi:hypothetical protein
MDMHLVKLSYNIYAHSRSYNTTYSLSIGRKDVRGVTNSGGGEGLWPRVETVNGRKYLQ